MFSRGKLLCDLVNVGSKQDANYEHGTKREDDHSLESQKQSPRKSNSRQSFDELMTIVGGTKDDDTQPSTSAVLTDISNNFVQPAKFNHITTENFMSSNEDFSLSDSEYIPNTDEDSTDCELEERRQITIPETSSSSIGEVENQTNLSLQRSIANSRKRNLNKSSWKSNIRKQNAITGKAYTSKKGKFVAERKMKSVCACRLKCSQKINENDRNSIFQKYYAENMTWDLKRQFILSRVSEVETARSRRRDPNQPPKRSCTLNYTFLVNENVEKVCKKFFLNTLAISETVVRNTVKKSKYGFVQTDRRGRHPPPNKTSEIVKETVRQHINMIPKYESHYSRNRTKKMYLGSHLNIDKLYSLYIDSCTENATPKENIAKSWLYRHIFNTEFNLGFNPPANDTCDDCDAYVVKYKNTTDETIKNTMKVLHDKHLEESNLRYSLKGFDKVAAFESHGTKKILTVDLQKCLPTPYLTNGQSFYYRKLWTFNFTIMDSVPKESWCFMWDETVAGRGGNEMASGVVKFFEQLDERVLEVTIWSDNCAGQNKNINLIMSYLWILSQKKHLKIINHKYLLKGHTHMEVDVIHSIIEREKKKIQEFPIVTPWDWQQFIKSCSKNTKIKVINMEANQFLDFTTFYEGTTASFVHRKKSNSGESVPYSSIVWMQFRQEEKGSMFYKTAFNQETFEEVSFIRNKRRGLSVLPTPKPIRENRKPISRLKYIDLQKSLQWIPSMFHDYYKNLPCADVPDLPEASE